MPIQPGFGVRRRIRADVAGITVGQIKRKEERLLLDTADHNQRFAKVGLGVSRRMAQRNKHLLAGALPGSDVVFDDRVTATEPTFVTKPFKDPLGRMALLAWTGLVFRKPLVDLTRIRIKPGTPDRRRSPISGRLRIRQHLRNTVPADPKIPGNPAPAQPFLKVSVTHLQIQIHGEYPQALPKSERAKVDDFYAARDSTVPPLPWTSIAPPFSGLILPKSKKARFSLASDVAQQPSIPHHRATAVGHTAQRKKPTGVETHGWKCE